MIYTGTDLRGWKTEDKRWKSRNWRLTFNAGDDDGASVLWTEERFGEGSQHPDP